MKQSAIYILILFGWLYNNVAIAQTDEQVNTKEIIVIASYNLSREESKSNNWFPVIRENHLLTLQPGFSYQFYNNLAFQFDIYYSLLLNYTTMTTGNDSIESTDRNYVHGLGSAIGLTYLIPLSSTTYLFITPKVGIGWSRQMYDSRYWYNDLGWSKAEISFPVLVAGSKFLIKKDYAVITFIQYKRTSPYRELWYETRNNQSVTFGFGFSKYF